MGCRPRCWRCHGSIICLPKSPTDQTDLQVFPTEGAGEHLVGPSETWARLASRPTMINHSEPAFRRRNHRVREASKPDGPALARQEHHSCDKSHLTRPCQGGGARHTRPKMYCKHRHRGWPAGVGFGKPNRPWQRMEVQPGMDLGSECSGARRVAPVWKPEGRCVCS